jgi:hypothetical protein
MTYFRSFAFLLLSICLLTMLPSVKYGWCAKLIYKVKKEGITHGHDRK